MLVEERRRDLPTGIKTLGCWQFRDGKLVPAEAELTEERELSIYLNGGYFATASLTPVMVEEFVLGHLLGQGLIHGPEEVDLLEIGEDRAIVTFKNVRRPAGLAGRLDQRIVSGGGRITYLRGLSLPAVSAALKLSPRTILQAMERLFEAAPIYHRTEGTHAAGIFTVEGKPVVVAEDIGRHNAVDKAVGYAVRHRVDLTATFLATTGRMSSEMVIKVCRAGIPVAATKAAVTAGARDLARRCGITLIGFVRHAGMRLNTDMGVRVIPGSGMKIYTGEQRVSGGNANEGVK